MIGLIGAMRVEIEDLTSQMTQDTVEEIGMDKFHHGILFGKEVVIASCGPGKVNAALCTQNMITRFHPECVLNLGVAGSGEDDVEIGDMVIATCAVQHDCDTTALGDRQGLVSKLNMIELPCDDTLRGMIVRACEKTGGIKVHQGVIATGDQFISTAEKRREIHEMFGSKAVEMEGGAVAQACMVNGVPCGIIRSISDNANGASVVDYPTFLRIAASHSQSVVEKLLREIM